MRYRVGFLITHSQWSIAAVRSAIIAETDNDAIVVVGDTSVIRVHAITHRPDALLAVGLSAGRIADVLIEPRDVAAWSQADPIVPPVTYAFATYWSAPTGR